MTKTKIKHTTFTPLFDSVTEAQGLYTSAVFGRVWRYCQMELGYCHATQERIGDELGISRKKVNEALGILVAAGYLRTIPNNNGMSVIYIDTGKAGAKAELPTIEAEAEQEPMMPEKKPKANAQVEAFLASATPEQVEAYNLVRRFSSIDKALEKANDENPLEAARDFLQWCADRDGKKANKVLLEIEGKEYRAGMVKNARDNCNLWFSEFIEANGIQLDDATYETILSGWYKKITEDESEKLVSYFSSYQAEEYAKNNLQLNIEVIKHHALEYADV